MLRRCPQGSVGQMAEKPRRSAFWIEKWVTSCNLPQHPLLAFSPRPSFSVTVGKPLSSKGTTNNNSCCLLSAYSIPGAVS